MAKTPKTEAKADIREFTDSRGRKIVLEVLPQEDGLNVFGVRVEQCVPVRVTTALSAEAYAAGL